MQKPGLAKEVDYTKISKKTAMKRKEGSVALPTRILLDKGLIVGNVLHHGSGQDIGSSKAMSDVAGSVTDFDPNFTPDFKALNKKYDTVISNYVINTLPPDDRNKALIDIAKTTKGVAYIAVRGMGNVIAGEPKFDGVITSKVTFQKIYSPDVLMQELALYFNDVKIISGTPKSSLIIASACNPK